MTSPPAADGDSAGHAESDPRILCDARALAEDPPVPSGVLWKLAESGRQLDANVVRIAPGGRITTHTETQLDVMLLVVAGDGVLGAGPSDAPRPLTEGSLVWLPHGSTRSIAAGDAGLTYLTVHRRRPGMSIGTRPGTGITPILQAPVAPRGRTTRVRA